MNSLFSRAAVAGLLMGVSVFAGAADALKSQEPPEGAKVFIVSPLTERPSTRPSRSSSASRAWGSSLRAMRPRTRVTIICWLMSTKSLRLTSRCRPP